MRLLTLTSPAKIFHIQRQHSLIETGLHNRRDGSFHEDRTRMTIGPAGRILATIHNPVLGLIKRAFITIAIPLFVNYPKTYTGIRVYRRQFGMPY